MGGELAEIGKIAAGATIITPLALKVFGPTAEYMGTGLKDFAAKRVENVNRIIKNAFGKLGEKAEEPGAVPPKVLKGILDEGSFCDDELGAEYFGGVLASSRSGVNRDDRGAAFLSLIGRLSSYQIRTHYVFYHIIKSLNEGLQINLQELQGRIKAKVYVPFEVFYPAMDPTEGEEWYNLLPHIMFGLLREGLIETFEYGNKVRDISEEVTSKIGGIMVQPSAIGIELFLWAYGKSGIPINAYLLEENTFELKAGIAINSGSIRVSKEDPTH